MNRYDLRGAFVTSLAAMAAHDSPVLNVQEAAEYIGRSTDYVRRVVRYEIPVVQHGKRGPLQFFKTDLDRWLASFTTTPVR